MCAENVFQFAFLSLGLPLTSEIRRISANVRLAPFVLEVDLRLIKRRVEEVVAMQLHARAGGRADAGANPVAGHCRR